MIRQYGWDDGFAGQFAAFADQGLQPSRVIWHNRDQYRLLGCAGERNACLSGKFRYLAAAGEAMPATGDWVAVQEQPGSALVSIRGILPRRSCFSRKSAGVTTTEQVLAANIDTVFVVAGLDGNFNLRRLERYLAVCRGSKASPVILLNKADCCPNAEETASLARAVAVDVPVHCVSAISGMGLADLAACLIPGKTLAFLGSSGVGKSTIINRLFGEQRQSTQATSLANGKGRHTTTRAELILHESGSLLLDTPGLRELTLWCDEETLDDSFADISALTARCRYTDCRHQSEPGCAVRLALEDGSLSAGRFANYQKLYHEVRVLRERQEDKASQQARQRRMKIMRGLKDNEKPSTILQE